MNIDWNSIRAINGSHRDGFEELVVQFAREETPANARFERVGAPDAGVECYCVLDDGGEWGWQAKYFTSSLTSSQWQQIDDSVETALDKHPGLVRYFVCVPWNRPDPRIPDRKSAMQRWKEHVSKWEGWAHTRGLTVEFVWWGASELLERLSQSEHIGRRFFWFSERYFESTWYDDRLKEAIDAAGPRYTPELHVDLPVARDLELFGRTDAAVDGIKAIARDVRRSFRNVSLSREEKEKLRGSIDLSELFQSRDAILDAFADLHPEPVGELPMARIIERIGEAFAESDKLVEPLERLSREHDSQPREIDDRPPYPTNPYRNVLHLLGRLRYELQNAQDKLRHAGRIVNNRVMILNGDAGTGKTHLLCDAVSSRLKNGLPTIMLMGQWFTDSTEPWTQALQQLDMPRDATAEQFIGALEASAQVANRRALIVIDAVNEGRGRVIWPSHLTSFLSRIERSPWIGVILSVRTSYEEYVIDNDVRERAVKLTHVGFEGLEYDAVRIFSEHYGIEFTSTPILNPEFQNPLFLKITFEGLQRAGERMVPRGFSGVTDTFNLYLSTVDTHLAKTLNYDPKKNLVWRALEEIAARMLDDDEGTRSLPRQEAEKVVNALLPGRDFSESLFHGLIVEGVLAEDMAWGKEGQYEVVRFTYERFSDHIIANFLLRKHVRGFQKPLLPPVEKTGLRLSLNLDALRQSIARLALKWRVPSRVREIVLRYMDPKNPRVAFAEGGGLAFVSDKFIYTPAGILEALCVQVPERTGQELIRLAPSLLNNAWRIGEAFSQSIVWRKSNAFSDDTRQALNELIQEGAVRDVFDTLLTVATIPGHYFNANSLDRTLRCHTMPDRDAWWSVYLHRAWQNDRGPVHRLVDWASSVSSDDHIQDEVIDLAATALVWMFSTSNRSLRDKATKALVSLLTGRVDATERVINRFNDVDDPYVRERVYAVAYGVAMRSQDAAEIEVVGRAVYENIFASGQPPVHMLLRDYARGVVEHALHLNESMAIDRKLLRPPYGSDWPQIPDDAEIERLTPHWNDGEGKWGTPEWARNRIRRSVMGDDFARYVIGTNSSSRSSRWLELRLDENLWESYNSKLKKLLQRMNQNESDAYWDFRKTETYIYKRFAPTTRVSNNASDGTLQLVIETPKERDEQILHAFEKLLSGLTVDNRIEMKGIWETRDENPEGFDLSLVQRYILGRVFELGWTVERFGYFDSTSIGYSGRHTNKVERIGKKYQWIAYHEVLAHLADNYQYRPEYNGSGQVFQGAWQDIQRDIDPSCMMASKPGGTGWQEHYPSWWAPTTYEDWNEDVDHQAWLDADNDFPEIMQLLHAVHPVEATEWFIVDGSFHWEQPHPADTERYGNPTRQIGIICQAYFIRADDAEEFVEWVKDVDFWGRWMPNSPESYGSDLFLGEYAWSPAFEYLMKSLTSDDESEGWRNTGRECPITLLPTSFHYAAGCGGSDCSIDDGYSLYLPNAAFTEKLGLRWTGVGADFIDKQGRIVAFDPTAHEDGAHALLIRHDALKQFLAENSLALCWAVVGEKMVVGLGDRHSKSLKFRKLTGACLLTDEGMKRIHQGSSYW